MSIPTISPTELKINLDDSSMILIDVREPVEYNQGHIPGAIHIPLKLLNPNTLPDNTSPIVFYCQGGNRASKAATLLLATQKNRVIKNLQGGLTAWKQAGLPINKNYQVISIHRQLFIIIGSIISFFSLLVMKGHQSFVTTIFLIGLGMIFAGATGFCLLSRILKKLPWNKNL